MSTALSAALSAAPRGTREAKRYATARRLQWCALELTTERGYDGWTMDDLAASAEVSRRTVFNYFDSRAAVVLGPETEVDDATVQVFVAGGPTGNLLDDVLVLARQATTEQAEDLAMLPAIREAIMNDGRLVAMVHERFEVLTEKLADVITEREGTSYPPERARLLLRLLLTFFDNAVERAGSDTAEPFADVLEATVADARVLLTR